MHPLFKIKMKFLFLILLGYTYTSCSQTLVSEGLLEAKDFILRSNESGFDTLKMRMNRNWYSDSAVIVELRVVELPMDNDTNDIEKYTTYKYTYLDVRTKKCQDYYSFSDTASVQCNYYLNPGEALRWEFYMTGKEKAEDFVELNNSIIFGKKLKILESRDQKFTNNYTRSIYYLDCDPTIGIFHLAKPIDLQFKNCRVIRSDQLDRESGDIFCFELSSVRQNLTEEEKKIFKSWAKNAELTNKPLIDFQNSYNECSPAHSTLMNWE